MKEKLIHIVGKNVLNGESSASTVVKLAKIVDYLTFQMQLISKESDDSSLRSHISKVLDNADIILNERQKGTPK